LDDNLSHAKAIATFTGNYFSLIKLYLESHGDSYLIAEELSEKNNAALRETLRSIHESGLFDFVLVTDFAGKVISSYPYSGFTGNDLMDRPYVQNVISSGSSYISDPKISVITNTPTVYVSVPVKRENGTVVGALVCGVSLRNFSDDVLSTQVKHQQYIYIVNRTGHIMVHNNKYYVDKMENYSMISPVKSVIEGKRVPPSIIIPLSRTRASRHIIRSPNMGGGS